MKEIKLLDKNVGDGNPCYTVAEIGGSFTTLEEAQRLIDSVLEMGLDAVKFQTLQAETITTKNNFFDMEATGKSSQYEIFKHFELSKELQIEVVNYAKRKNIPVFSAPSHIKDLEIMEEFDIPFYKIGSDLACHIPLLRKVAKLKKPIILSTGMCTLEEVRNSVKAIRDEGNEEIILMHCVSNYPSTLDELNLRTINMMKQEFEIPVGFSDHTPGILATTTSVSMGANIIERHFRDPRNPPGPDDVHSLTKTEFFELKNTIRDIEKTFGTGEKKPTESEKKHMKTNRVSIIAMQSIPKGTIIEQNMIDIRRPGNGIQPIDLEKVIGKRMKKTVSSEEPLSWDMLE